MKKRFLIWDNPQQAIIMLVLGLLVIGSINVFSATYMDAAASDSHDALEYFKKYWLTVLVGLVAGGFAYKLGYKRILNNRLIRWVLNFAVFFMLAVLFVKRNDESWQINGAARWLRLGGFSLQPSELAKVSVIMYSAYILDKMHRYKQAISFVTRNPDFWKLIVMTLIYSFLVYKQPDMGTATIIFGLTILMIVMAGFPRFQLWAMVGTVASVGAVIAVSASYRLRRLAVWLDPWKAAGHDGYQGVQSQLAIGSGGLWGSNWDYAASRYFHLPESHTDFAFAFFCNENGFFFAVVLILLFSLLALAFMAITCSAKHMQAFLLASGITFLIIGQSFANIAMVCGVLPIIGVPLPFISYGGTSMIINLGCIGLLLSIYKEEKQEAELAALSPDSRREDLRVVHGRGARR